MYTIINADGDGTVVTFENGETNDAVLTGFTITGGVGTLDYSYEDSYYSYKQFYGVALSTATTTPRPRSAIASSRGTTPYYEIIDDTTYDIAYSSGGRHLLHG